jgi:very-short-patch-repair endonuclease
VDALVQQLVALLEEELAEPQRLALMDAEQEHWQRVMAPRMEQYRHNQQQLFGGPARL